MSINSIADRLQGKRVGYVPYRTDFSAPGDRRRFCRWAAQRGVTFEIADPTRDYDVVVLSERADISAWRRYNGRAKLVYDLIDSYLAERPRDFKGALRGAAKFVVRQSRHLEVNFRDAVAAMCARSDAVVCSTEEQRRDIAQFCENVHIILDVQTATTKCVKHDYSTGRVFNLVWEGLADNIAGFKNIVPVLRELASEREVALHLITDLSYYKYLGRVRRVSTAEEIGDLGVRTYLYSWNEEMMAPIATACDLAIIPLASDDPFARGKPENKLLMFWRLGIPALTTRTPAYERANSLAGLNMTCASLDDWRRALRVYADSAELRTQGGLLGRGVADAHYSEAALLSRWDAVFASILDG